MKLTAWMFTAALTIFSIQPAMAEDCDEMIEETREEIKKNPGDYERDAIRDANRLLGDAAKELRDDNEAACKAHVRKANRKLRRNED